MSTLSVGTLTTSSVVFGANGTQSKAVNAITDLNNISSTAPTTNQVLRWNGSQYVPVTLPIKVLQYQDYRYPSANDNYTQIAADTDYDTPVTITITPLSATSRLIVHGVAHTRFINAYGMSGGLKRGTSKISGNQNVGGLYFFYKGDQVNHHHNVECDASVISGSTAATTFTVWIRPYAGTGEWNQGWGNNYIQVWEVEV